MVLLPCDKVQRFDRETDNHTFKFKQKFFEDKRFIRVSPRFFTLQTIGFTKRIFNIIQAPASSNRNETTLQK
jgi:hypothetical protein